MNFISASLWPSCNVAAPVSVCTANAATTSFYSHSPLLAPTQEPEEPSPSPSNSSSSSSSPSQSLSQSGSLQKRKRMRMTPEQLKVLQKAFLQNPMPSASCRSLLAKRLGMNCRSVQIWFQNRRAKLKQQDRKRDEDSQELLGAEAESDFTSDSPVNPTHNPSLALFTQPQPKQRIRSFSAVGVEEIRFCYSPATAPAFSVSPSDVAGAADVSCAFPRDEQLYFGNDGIYQGDNSPFFSAAGKVNSDDFCLPSARPLDEEGLGMDNLLLLPTPSVELDEGLGTLSPIGTCGSGKKRSFSISCDFSTPTILDSYLPFPFGGVGGVVAGSRGGSGIRASCDLFEFSLGSDEHEH
jgi:hypothetical protein